VIWDTKPAALSACAPVSFCRRSLLSTPFHAAHRLCASTPRITLRLGHHIFGHPHGFQHSFFAACQCSLQLAAPDQPWDLSRSARSVHHQPHHVSSSYSMLHHLPAVSYPFIYHHPALPHHHPISGYLNPHLSVWHTLRPIP